MSKFHSIVTRRDFMKGIGFGAVGLGAAGVAGTVFHDLDELISTPARDRAWWVKEKEEPTVDIDWNMMARHHSFHSTQSTSIITRYLGFDAYNAMVAQQTPAAKAAILANTPGLTLRDQALYKASVGLAFSAQPTDKFADSRFGNAGFVCKTPDQWGVPKWQGTPEENLKMMQAAMTFFGASQVGAAELDANHKKLMATHGRQSIANTPYQAKSDWPPTETFVQPMVFADQKQFAYDTVSQITTIPSSGVYSVNYTIPQSNEMFRTTPNSALFGAANITRYRLRETAKYCTQSFVRGLGYQMMYDEPYGFMPSVGGATLTGLVENGRHSIMGISPEYGSTVGLYELLTDLPMAHTKPVDAGIWRFCQTCGICAANCPSQSIEPKGGRAMSYEPYASQITPVNPPLQGWGFSPMGAGEAEYYKTGRKTYWTDGISCAKFRAPLPNGCQLCFGVCVFNSQHTALVHNVVRGTVANTSLLNGFFAKMDTTFGFGLKDGDAKEEWWNMSLPSYGYNTAAGSRNGGYV